MDSTAVAEIIKDIKGPVYFPANYLFLIIIAAVIILAALVFSIIFFLKRNLKRQSGPSSVSFRPADQIAYQALENLKAKNLPRFGKIKEYYIELSDIVRHYMENRFSLPAPEMTTEEFLYSLRESKSLKGSHKNLLKQFLNHCDMVKFAKYGPTEQEMDDSFNSAKKLVDETRCVDEQMEKVSVK